MRLTALPLSPAWALALCAACLIPGVANAQYKWKDNRGQVHVSDLPPPRDIPDAQVLQRPATPAARAASDPAPAGAAARSNSPAAGAASRPPVDSELEARRKKAELEAQARQQADEARLALQRAENCQRARQQLAALDSGQRLQRTNDRGERVILDDGARAAERDSVRRVAEAECR